MEDRFDNFINDAIENTNALNHWDELRNRVEQKYPVRKHKFEIWPLFSAYASRQHLGFDTPHVDGMIIIAQTLNVSYTYEPEYVNAHAASFSYYLRNGRWLRFEFSWPRRSSKKGK